MRVSSYGQEADLGRRVQQRQGVDEAEELDLDGLVGHGPFHEALVEPARRERQGAALVEPGEQGVAVGPRQALEVVGRLRVVRL